MPITSGFNHVATLTTNMDLTVRFYEEAFGGKVTFEVAKRDDHPWMKIVDLGGGAALNIFEVPVEEIIGERRRQGRRGAIDHFALTVDSRAALEQVKERLLTQALKRSARSSSWARSSRCSSATRRHGARGLLLRVAPSRARWTLTRGRSRLSRARVHGHGVVSVEWCLGQRALVPLAAGRGERVPSEDISAALFSAVGSRWSGRPRCP